jgi:hypothetical protein
MKDAPPAVSVRLYAASASEVGTPSDVDGYVASRALTGRPREPRRRELYRPRRERTCRAPFASGTPG